MKKLRFIGLAIAAAFAFAACNPEEKKDDGKLYRITVTAGENGTATASRTEAEAGDNITLTATPADGFAFEAWTVTSGNASVADATAASTTFTMPAGDVEIRAAFVEEDAELDDTEDILPKFVDAGFKQYAELRIASVEKIENTTYPAWDANGDGKLTAKEAAQVKAINLGISAEDIYSFEDLHYFKNLEILVMDGCYNLESGQEYISRLPKLKVFRGSDSVLGELDFSGCPDLNTVVCEDAILDKINVSTCSKLIELDLYYAGISELDLSECTALTELTVRLTHLTRLDVSHCANLNRLDAASVPLEELKLPENSKITRMYVNKSRLSELDMTQHPNIEYLSASSPYLTKLDMTKCTKLKQLTCAGSPIGELDLSNCHEIDLLWAYSCQLTKINLKGCSKLFECYIEHNNLTEIDASDLGFWCDDKTGEMTNTYLYHLGAQVEPGTEPYTMWDDEISPGGQTRHLDWAGHVEVNGKRAVPREVTIYLREEQRSYWEDACGRLEMNCNLTMSEKYPDYPDGVNNGHVNVIFIN